MSEEATKLDRILKALNHPIRRRILRTLADQPGSASSLAEEFGLELSSISYHLNRVLAEGCNAVELVKMIPRRGSVEKIYRLNPDLWSDRSAAPHSSGEARGALRTLAPGECFLEAVEAIDANAFVELDGSAWEWFPATIDIKAWKEIQSAKRDFNDRVEGAVEEFQESPRRRRRDTYEVVVGVAAFPAAPRGEGS